MNKEWTLLMAFMPVAFELIGIIVGVLRYKKYGAKIRQQEEQKYKDAQAKGGLHTLFWKKPYKRVVVRTFGIPMLIGMAAGLVWIWILFQKL